MNSDIDVGNLALSNLGERANISSFDPPEGSAHAELVARFYPLARDTLLEGFAWSFALKRAPLALVEVDSNEYDYVYAVPQDCLKVWAVFGEDSAVASFTVEADENSTLYVCTDAPDAVISYTIRPLGAERFSAMFAEALAARLASMLAGPIIRGEEGMKQKLGLLKISNELISMAQVADANQGYRPPPHYPSSLMARQ
jgi:hypothetical protein